MENRKSILRCLGLLVALLFLLASSASSEEGKAKPKAYANPRVTEENGVVTLCYDLLLTSAARVDLAASVKGQKLTVEAVTGDAGIVLGPAKDMCLRWDTLKDHPEGLSNQDVTLDLMVKEYIPPSGKPPEKEAAAQVAGQAEIIQCLADKITGGFKSEKDEITERRNDYMTLLSSDQAPYIQMLQNVKGGTPFVKRWERDRNGRQVPVYQYEDLPDREKAKLQRELDKQLEKAERNPNSVISPETKRAKDKFEASVDRLFTRLAAACERDLGVPTDILMEWILKLHGPGYLLPEPFDFIRKQKDWD